MKGKKNYNRYRDDDSYRITQRETTDKNITSRLNYKIPLFIIQHYNGGGTYLDIGSQEGQFAGILSKEASIESTTCIDINQKTINQGKKRYPAYRWICADIVSWLAQSDQVYDLVTIVNSLYYFFTEDFLNNLFNHTKKEGMVITSYHDGNFLQRYGYTDDNVIEMFENAGFETLSIIRSYEPIKECSKVHLTANRWYTTIAFRKLDVQRTIPK